MPNGPPARLRHALADQRDAGAEFEEAWQAALAHALRGVGADRRAWRRAFEQTRPAWTSAYVGHAPPPSERALAAARELSGRELPLNRGERRALRAVLDSPRGAARG